MSYTLHPSFKINLKLFCKKCILNHFRNLSNRREDALVEYKEVLSGFSKKSSKRIKILFSNISFFLCVHECRFWSGWTTAPEVVSTRPY